ncbi:GLPGLI family protein [Sphingobacterium alimentarium]|uniref:GLPGLI family protein n=1 Tax=Sphingobacterium alimentarium TaxID=797292 RepID=A0A4R3VNS7_9SPHI|nr:GLPGLI family protein [Sphingobacterium alimentarium]TCV06605.1 GLPGLI family protein [Sphingobacterium alimentarium]
MKKLIILFLILISAQLTFAQYTYFPTSGTITYERKFHLQNYLKRKISTKADVSFWDKANLEHLQKSGPHEVVTHHVLKFYDMETVFETLKEDYPPNYRNAMWFLPIHAETKTYVNYQKGTFLKLLPFGDDELLLADTIPKVKWKYTDEYRNIAGYDCRRANGLIQDSIYVVAFFTNQLEVPGGPELIQGLPGTILGVSIPSKNINMFATKVELSNDIVSSTLTKKKKVVPESREAVIKKLKSSVYDYLDDKTFQEELSKILF